MTPLTLLAAWSVLSVPAALAVGALLDAVNRRAVAPAELVPVVVRADRVA